jgi:MSHA biogenesis protein MshM
MYYEYFGLNQAPFRITPNTDFFFSGGNRGPILEALIYAIVSGEGIVKVTGEVGSGKTMLCNMLQARLPPRVETVYLAHPNVSPEEIAHAIAAELQLDVDRAAPRLEVMHRLQEHLLRRHAEGRRVVVFVEEAQGMPLATLEEIRLLSNLETRNDKLLQIVLFGQPELDENLARPSIRQLRERITHSFRLEPFTVGEIREYLMFRLRAAGYRGPDLFSAPVVKAIARASRGLTRRINLIADKALLAAFSENTHTIRRRHVAAALRDSDFSRESRGLARPRLAWAAALVLAGATAGAVVYALAIQRGAAVTVSAVASPPIPSAGGDASHETSMAASSQKRAGETRTVDPRGRAKAPGAAFVNAARTESSPPVAEAGERSRDLLAERLAATESWLAAADETTYSIQLLSTEDENRLRRELGDVTKFIELNGLFLYRLADDRKALLTVLYGSFADRHAALEALDKLPPALKVNQPFLRTVGSVRAEIRRRAGS